MRVELQSRVNMARLILRSNVAQKQQSACIAGSMELLKSYAAGAGTLQ